MMTAQVWRAEHPENADRENYAFSYESTTFYESWRETPVYTFTRVFILTHEW